VKAANPGRSRSGPFFAALRVPAIIISLLLVPFAIYYINVSAQREYLTSRNFRILATMGDQIKVTVDNFQPVIKNACGEAAQGKLKLDAFLQQAGLELTSGGSTPTPRRN
jgi:hypothetical protein